MKRLMDVRAELSCQLIATCRRQEDGGKWTSTEDARLMLLREAIAEGVDYVDLELEIAGKIPRFGKTKRIVSHHDFRKTPDNLREIHAELAAQDADIVKIATTANTPHDNLRMLELVQESEIPTVGFCMGDIGTPSRILCGKFGSPLTYSPYHRERIIAPGQISFREMTEVYHYEQINADTQVYGVIADPVGHSLSPNVHNACFAEKGINSVYCPFRVPADKLDEFIEDDVQISISVVARAN